MFGILTLHPLRTLWREKREGQSSILGIGQNLPRSTLLGPRIWKLGLTEPVCAFGVDGIGVASACDALLIINELNVRCYSCHVILATTVSGLTKGLFTTIKGVSEKSSMTYTHQVKIGLLLSIHYE